MLVVRAYLVLLEREVLAVDPLEGPIIAVLPVSVIVYLGSHRCLQNIESRVYTPELVAGNTQTKGETWPAHCLRSCTLLESGGKEVKQDTNSKISLVVLLLFYLFYFLFFFSCKKKQKRISCS